MKKIFALFLALSLFNTQFAFAAQSAVSRVSSGSGGSGSVSDDAYGAGWNGATTTGPSQNAVYDKLEALTLGGAVDDTAYNATTWNGVTASAPSQNAVRDKLEALYIYTDATNANFGFGELTFEDITVGSGIQNTAVGDGALKNLTTGDYNTAVGYNALSGVIATATWNTAVGYSALSGPLSATAIKNTFVGGETGISVTDATLVTCVGYHSCQGLTTGSSNTLVGVDAGYDNQTGGSLVGFGYSALANALAGPNVAVGNNSLLNNTTGINNAALGHRACGANLTGEDNVCIGDEAGYSNFDLDNSNMIIIGSGVSQNYSNSAVIGNTTMTSMSLFGTTLSAPGTTLSLGMPGTTARVWGMTRNTSSAQHGSNFTLKAGGASKVGQITTVGVTAGGTGYVVGDVITIDGAGNADAIVGVTTVSGGAVTGVSRIHFGSGYSVASGVTTTGGTGTGFTANVTGVATATDRNGGALILQPGESTGTGNAQVRIQNYTKATSTGSTDNTAVDRIVVTGAKTLTDAATSLFEIALPTLTMTGGSIDWTIEASDGTDMQSLSGITTFSAVNKGAAYTTTVTNNTSNDAKAVSAGTLTTTWAFLTGTNKVTMQVTPAGSLTETTYRVTYTVTNNSPQAITIL